VTFSVSSTDPKNVQLAVRDNGVGISPENLQKIFSFGFTTKKDGHGFGLHNSALAAKEMNGKLFAKSEGLGKGAEFVLVLPVAETVLPAC
ncbi:MAG TPA: ATP-binding protein, partial [Opitutaceae bacterium]